jgi:ATP-dependent protease ClpP protease subunit
MGASAIAFRTSAELRQAAGGAQQTAESSDAGRDTVVAIYAARTRVSRSDIMARMEHETWLTAKQSNDRGFADRVQLNKSIAAS